MRPGGGQCEVAGGAFHQGKMAFDQERRQGHLLRSAHGHKHKAAGAVVCPRPRGKRPSSPNRIAIPNLGGLSLWH